VVPTSTSLVARVLVTVSPLPVSQPLLFGARNRRALSLARICALFECALEDRVSPTREAGVAFWQLTPI
jgi:hypothetical protein